MTKTVWMTVAVTLATMAVAVAAPLDDGAADDTLRKAHEDLQRALETIRTYHLQEGLGHLESEPGFHDDLLVELRRPRLGILVDSTSRHDGQPGGAVIVAVTPGGPADEAGLESGDVITHIDGVELAGGVGRAHDVLIRELATRSEGDTVTVDFVRDGEARSVPVVLRGHEGEPLVLRGPLRWAPSQHLELREATPGSGVEWLFPGGWLDMELVSINADLGEYFGTDEGVLVVRGPSSGELGLRGGDVILAIADRVVKSPTHAMRILRSYEPDERLVVEIMRRGKRESIEVAVPEHRVPILESWDHRE
jgi:C-terminal processing protease CtpA/Prc